ncbi:BTB/POZ protein [Penicillium riverlandense]|uniref:BTB/POZ protein n=1 Tax=Penicillium riverlandense TaxID=1903569 RepID=UPI0025472F28|nr:BTB/POZ protein [Penicillium riverlandense]KAJ5818319.1 BTB/POZ protein [Penicillium riverlandense]
MSESEKVQAEASSQATSERSPEAKKLKAIHRPTSESSSFWEKHDGELTTSLRKYFHSGEHSNIKICSTEREFKVHILVVCGQSEYFARAFNGNGNWAEKEENAIYLKEDHPRAVLGMIAFFYGFRWHSPTFDRGELSYQVFLVMLYQLADKYAIPLLKKQSKNFFEDDIKIAWDDPKFLLAITEVYQRTLKSDRALRDPVVRTCLEHLDNLKQKEDFRKMLEEIDGFAADLVLRTGQLNSSK